MSQIENPNFDPGSIENRKFVRHVKQFFHTGKKPENMDDVFTSHRTLVILGKDGKPEEPIQKEPRQMGLTSSPADDTC